jgi:hypothetical protein
MPFGKFKGVALEDVPESYLCWLRYVTLDPNLLTAVEGELFERSAQALIALCKNRSCGIHDLLLDFIRSAEFRGYERKSLDQLKAIAHQGSSRVKGRINKAGAAGSSLPTPAITGKGSPHV